MNYYNEWDKHAAAWLRELIKQGHIPYGIVDERSIEDVQPEDLDGFTQCHFFAGIGGWPLALRLAGVSESTRLWTGSPPCQPFSTAGRQLGQFDPRHLAPTFLRLVSECRPAIIFGEQVAPAIAKSWMCDLQTHLEREDYAVGFAVLPACSVGAPHKRDRLFFGAYNLAESLRAKRDGERVHGLGESNQTQGGWTATEFAGCGGIDKLAHTDYARLEGRERMSERTNEQPAGPGGVEGTADSHNGFWSDADWLGCRDGKFRPVESGTFPLANGIPARVGRLRGYGNAIVPQVAAEFIKAFINEG